MNKISFSAKEIAYSAIIAALYVALTGVFAPLSFGAVQIRIPEALCALAIYTFAAIPGMTLGCLISNLLWSPFGILDVLLGTLATFLGVVGVYCLRKKNRIVALAPPVITNALIVPVVIISVSEETYLLSALTIFAGQAVSCLGLGYSLSELVKRFFKTS